jgi:tetratricopeptide (TPR) repeat protein
MTPGEPTFPITAPKSAAAAYRADLVGRDGPFGQHDSAWLTVASLLQHAAYLNEPERSRLVIDAIEFSREVIGEANVGRLGTREWEDRDRAPIEAIMLLADAAHREGALNLAGAILDALFVADASLDAVQRGRIISQRARVLRKMGLIDEAAHHDRYVSRLGRHAKNVELRVRGSLGFATLAQLRGNYPDMYRHSHRALRMAERAGLRRLTRDACIGLQISLGVSRRFDEALIYGWKVYQLSIGHAIDEGEVLQNIGQLLFDSGHFAEARAGFAAVVSHRLPAHILLPALGGLALASARTGQPETVEWSAIEIERLAGSNAPRYSIASALLEAAIALFMIGKNDIGERHRVAAAQLGRKHSFHEIVFRAEAIEPASPSEPGAAPLVLTKEAATVVSEIAWLEPKQLPKHVALAAASS